MPTPLQKSSCTLEGVAPHGRTIRLMRSAQLEARFLSGAKGRIFLLKHRPEDARDCVLVVPPFAEEMNKCRRLVTQVARELARHGIATAVVDLYGTGESAGEFSEGDWLTWQRDLAATAQACREHGLAVSSILATRLGATLAAAASSEGVIPPVARTVLWQPVFDGARFIQQFLRMRVFARLEEQDQKETVSELRARLLAGEVVEVAGYGLSGRLSAQIEARGWPLVLPAEWGIVTWIEIGRSADTKLAPQAEQLLAKSREAGLPVRTHTIAGEPFWNATEFAEMPALVTATVDALLPEVVAT